MRISSFILILCNLLMGNITAQTVSNIIPRSHIAYKTDQALKIDGDSREEAWNKVAWSDMFIDIEGVKKPTYKTQVKMLWDAEYFYLLAKMEEPHVWANLKQRDTIIFHNNDFEIFVDPDGDTHNYYEFELNAYNTIWDLLITKPYREGNTILNDWTATGLKSAIKIDGTINNPNDKDKGWTLEMAIPWDVFKTSYFQKINPATTFWRINFSRVNWEFDLIDERYQRKKDKKGKLLHEYNWVWSPTGVINMHEPEKWGYVYFSSKQAGETDVFEIPQDEKIKWGLYRAHREIKAYLKKHAKYPTSIKDLKNASLKIDNIEILITFEKHQSGYNLIIQSPFTNKTLMVTEDGKYISK